MHMDKKEAAVWVEEHMRMWLDVRMQCGVATPLIALSALLAIMGRTASSNISVAAAGLAIQYAGRITDELISVVENFTWVGAQCVGIEKVCDYIDLPPEKPAVPESQLIAPPAEWPSAGRMVMRDITLTYRPGLEPALKGITCTIEAGEHIGIVGRTGAGKSSLTLAILRMADQVTGTCEIDGVDIAHIPLSTLRQRVAIIPQEATSACAVLSFRCSARLQHVMS
jgi:ATP-binding cassette subfamily C (CFTR/MRP) protein 1